MPVADKPSRAYEEVFLVGTLNLCCRCRCLVDPRYWDDHTRVCTDKEY